MSNPEQFSVCFSGTEMITLEHLCEQAGTTPENYVQTALAVGILCAQAIIVNQSHGKAVTEIYFIDHAAESYSVFDFLSEIMTSNDLTIEDQMPVPDPFKEDEATELIINNELWVYVVSVTRCLGIDDPNLFIQACINLRTILGDARRKGEEVVIQDYKDEHLVIPAEFYT